MLSPFFPCFFQMSKHQSTEKKKTFHPKRSMFNFMRQNKNSICGLGDGRIIPGLGYVANSPMVICKSSPKTWYYWYPISVWFLPIRAGGDLNHQFIIFSVIWGFQPLLGKSLESSVMPLAPLALVGCSM